MRYDAKASTSILRLVTQINLAPEQLGGVTPVQLPTR